jgi:hypothetical protein
MTRHRRLAALHIGVVERTAQHFRAHFPRSAATEDEIQRNALWLYRTVASGITRA